MTLTLLSQQASGTVLADGTANLTLRPDTGQFWLPSIVQVTTRGGTPIKCNLHAGGVAALGDSTTIKDFTYQGSNDTSTILSGMVISPGEGIRCEFVLGTPGEVVFFSLSGISSDTPPTIGIIPTVPGARFLGAANIGFQSGLATSIQLNIAMGGGTTAQSNTIDMRGYQSFNLVYEASFGVSPNNFVHINVSMVWFSDSTLTRVIYEDAFHIVPADSAHGAFDNPYNRVEFQDNVHGPFLKVFLSVSNSGLNPTFSLQIYGSSKTLPCQYIRNTQSFGLSSASFGSDGAALLAVTAPVAAGVQQFLMRYGPGPASCAFINGTGANTNVDIFTVSGELEVFASIIAAGAVTTFSFVYPKKQLIFQINNGAVANNAIIWCSRQLTQTGG